MVKDVMGATILSVHTFVCLSLCCVPWLSTSLNKAAIMADYPTIPALHPGCTSDPEVTMAVVVVVVVGASERG
jgi:hypothetical protein